MTKGTPSMGRRNKRSHTACRRCGRHSFHIKDSVCAACGFGRSAKLRTNSWQWKTIQRDRRF